MPTINQLVRRGRKKRQPNFDRVLQGSPQRAGIVQGTFTLEPRKPNSGNRKCARVRLKNGVQVTAHIPGIGHNLIEHAEVLVRGGNVWDLSGVKYKIIRGALDCLGVEDRTTSRSRYGAKKPLKSVKGDTFV